ncbi:MAG: HAMP domain-containing sensor histidine kinase, partial [Gemmatimonadaceae bacterium]
AISADLLMRLRRRAARTAIPFLTFDTTLTRGEVLAIGRFADSTDSRQSERFVVVIYDSASIDQLVFRKIAAQRSEILPTTVYAPADGEDALALRVQHRAGPLMFGNAVRLDSSTAQSEFLTMDGTLVVTASIGMRAAATTLGLAGGGTSEVPVLLLALGAVAAVLATCVLAWRSLQLARVRSDFAASVSHELRTPLTEIMLYAELVESGRTSTRSGLRDAGRLIRAEAQQLHHVVENALHLSRADRRLVRVSLQLQPLLPILRDAMAGFQLIAEQRQVTLRLDANETLRVAVDALALRHVLLNLLDNAVRYGPDGQEIVVRAMASGGGVRIEVDDAGPGVPEEDRLFIWKPFARLTRDVDRARSGSGLGLRIVRELVTQMHGTVAVETSHRQGALFVVRLAGDVASLHASPRSANGRATRAGD